MTMKLHYLQHVPFEDPGSIAGWVHDQGHVMTGTRLYAGETLPELTCLDWLIIMGGSMNVDETDHYPWLAAEKLFIKAAIDRGLPVTGICLGAQLIASALGARVTKNPQKEIGWFPVSRDQALPAGPLATLIPAQFDAFHWHGDTFELPAGAVRLASSAACRNQGFVYRERVIALQFHLEITPAGIRQLTEHCGAELVPAPYIQTAQALLADTGRFQKINELMVKLLDYQASFLKIG